MEQQKMESTFGSTKPAWVSPELEEAEELSWEDLEPGEPYLATVRGQENILVMLEDRTTRHFHSLQRVEIGHTHFYSDLQHVRRFSAAPRN